MRSTRVAAASSLLLLAGCSASPAGGGALQVLVNLAPGVTSRCAKVVVSDGATTKETGPIPLDMKASPLRVAVYGDGFTSPVVVKALGYVDAACGTASGEQSEEAEGSFGAPATSVTLTLRPVGASQPDGGTDGGRDAGLDAGLDAGAPDAGADAGVDAGVVDAGIDGDGDGSPLPLDCDDTDDTIFPSAPEDCMNGRDDNCDGRRDCAEQACDTFFCQQGGRCMNLVCITPTELCDDRADNNANGLIDCLDPTCMSGAACDDGDPCTVGEACVADGGCQATSSVTCTTPPADAQCYASTGTCENDGGAVCAYTALTGQLCDAGLCTLSASCTAGGACTGTPNFCAPPANTCLVSTGCQPLDGTCGTRPVDAGTGTCTDNDNCTLNDRCDGDGGCTGTRATCTPPSQCQAFTNTCLAGGTCIFTPRTGQACDAGAGMGPATCDSTTTCVPTPTLFPYTPSNFAESDLPATGGDVTINCAAAINTDDGGTTGACVSGLSMRVFTQPSGASTLLIRATNFTVQAGASLTLSGARPVIIAATGNVQVDGTMLARSGGGTSPDCVLSTPGYDGGTGTPWSGGGGGGFGTAGASGGGVNAGQGGGTSGNATLVPLRGGCDGARGVAGGGTGGGALQLSAAGQLTISGVVNAPGGGGAGAGPGTVSGDSGGGGGSGGALLLEGQRVELTSSARVTANGGGGGEGRLGQDGFNGAEGQATSSPAPGGSGGSNAGGNGGNGAAGTTAATPGAAGTSSGSNGTGGGGGGGGGVGRIRLNAQERCTLTSGFVLSPQASSNAAMNCP